MQKPKQTKRNSRDGENIKFKSFKRGFKITITESRCERKSTTTTN